MEVSGGGICKDSGCATLFVNDVAGPTPLRPMGLRGISDTAKDFGKGGCNLRFLAGPTGLEPATSSVTGRRSNQLSYDPTYVVAML